MRSRTERSQPLCRDGQRCRIAIQPQQLAVGRRCFQNSEGMPACAECAVNVAATGARLKRGYDFIVKDGYVRHYK